MIPEHESPVRSILSQAKNTPFYPLKSFEDAKSYKDGVAVFEGGEYEKLKSAQKREKGHKKLVKKAYDTMMKHKKDMDYTGDTDWRNSSH